MSKLVQSNRNKKKNLNRGSSIEPIETFKINNLDSNIKKEIINPTYTPKPASMKINSELRDKINALSLIGLGDNQKEVVERALTIFIETLTDDQKRTYDNQFDVLRKKTIKRET